MKKERLQKRMQKTWDLLSKLNDRISSLEKDHIMKKMDPDYVTSYHRDLTEMRRRLASTMSLSHLNEEEIVQLKDKLKPKKHRVRRNKNEPTIDGALADFYFNQPIESEIDSEQSTVEVDEHNDIDEHQKPTAETSWQPETDNDWVQRCTLDCPCTQNQVFQQGGGL